MNNEDMNLYATLINELSRLLNHKDRLKIENLPLEFGGVASDLLNRVDGKYSNDALLLLVDGLVQECEGKSDEEIISRFVLLRSTMLAIYERCKMIAENNKRSTL